LVFATKFSTIGNSSQQIKDLSPKAEDQYRLLNFASNKSRKKSFKEIIKKIEKFLFISISKGVTIRK
jgi:hypothetical protein